MEIRYQCTSQDYIEAQNTRLRKPPAYWAFFGAIGFLVTAWGAYQYFVLGDSQGLLFLMVIPLWMLLRYGVRPLWLRRDFRRHPNFALETEQAIDEEGFRSKSEVGEGRVKWGAYQNFRETPGLFMLYSGARTFHIFPKRAFTGPQQEEFRELLRRKLPKE